MNSNEGNGWFNADSTDGSTWRSTSVAAGLVDDGVVSGIIIDPSGARTNVGAYLIAASKNDYTLWAQLENPTTADTETLNNCHFDDYRDYANFCVSS